MKIDGDVRIPKAAYYQLREDFQATAGKLLFFDGFESGTTATWSVKAGGS